MPIFQTTIIGRDKIAENTIEVSLERPENFSFDAGQYIQLGVPALLYSDVIGSSRLLSIASSPLNQEEITVAFRSSESGFKRTLKELRPNAPMNIEGPHGFFTLTQNSSQPLILIAGGIGITPYLSMIRFATETDSVLPITLLYSNKSKESAAYSDELKSLSKINQHFNFKNRIGRIDEYFIHQNVKNLEQHIWHIAGPPVMVEEIRKVLSQLDINDSHVYFEEFTGYE